MDDRDDGFTLVEVLLVIVITTIIIGALAAALITSIRVSTETDERVLATRDAQLTSLYFTNDVQSAQSVLTSNPADCAAPSGFLLGLVVDDGKVVYRTLTSAAGELQLERRRCVIAGATSTQVLARDLNPAKPPVLTCPPAASCPADARKLQLKITTFDYDFTLRGTRRVTS